jgi:hypothetical protein
MTTTIYGLTSEDDKIRYVGKTIRPTKRIREHLWEAKSRQRSVYAWIRSLIECGQELKMVVLEVVDGDGFGEERKWIEHGKNNGWSLYNETSGGQGPSGKKWTEERKKKQSDRMKGKSVPHLRTSEASKNRVEGIIAAYAAMSNQQKADKNAKVSAAHLGKEKPWTTKLNQTKKWTPEMRAKVASHFIGKTRDNAVKQKMKDSWTEEKRQAKSIQMTGRKMSEETKRKIAEKMKEYRSHNG